ncbi:MAG TPA: hypothetical protein P5230_02755 [Candidatus Magasanikbacteria bacterium]|nr:hypothetical protein [Candidatus Magasanikbacteria bacterium]
MENSFPPYHEFIKQNKKPEKKDGFYISSIDPASSEKLKILEKMAEEDMKKAKKPLKPAMEYSEFKNSELKKGYYQKMKRLFLEYEKLTSPEEKESFIKKIIQEEKLEFNDLYTTWMFLMEIEKHNETELLKQEKIVGETEGGGEVIEEQKLANSLNNFRNFLIDISKQTDWISKPVDYKDYLKEGFEMVDGKPINLEDKLVLEKLKQIESLVESYDPGSADSMKLVEKGKKNIQIISNYLKESPENLVQNISRESDEKGKSFFEQILKSLVTKPVENNDLNNLITT